MTTEQHAYAVGGEGWDPLGTRELGEPDATLRQLRLPHHRPRAQGELR